MSVSEHVAALRTMIQSASGMRIVSGDAGKPGGFDRLFLSEPPKFTWGVNGVTARDALIDLLEHSATTFRWGLWCQPSAQAQDRLCSLTLGMLEVKATDAEGKVAVRPLKFDRCVHCPP